MGFYAMSSVIDPPAAPAASATGKAAPRHSRQATPLKKPRLEFFSTFRFRTGVFESQVVEPHRKTAPTPTIIVSGMSVWPSRDPIGEKGFAALRINDLNDAQIELSEDIKNSWSIKFDYVDKNDLTLFLIILGYDAGYVSENEAELRAFFNEFNEDDTVKRQLAQHIIEKNIANDRMVDVDMNLGYTFVSNNGILHVDILGLKEVCPSVGVWKKKCKHYWACDVPVSMTHPWKGHSGTCRDIKILFGGCNCECSPCTWDERGKIPAPK